MSAVNIFGQKCSVKIFWWKLKIFCKKKVLFCMRARCWSGSVPIITPERRLEQTAQRCAEEIMKGLPTSSMASSRTLCSRKIILMCYIFSIFFIFSIFRQKKNTEKGCPHPRWLLVRLFALEIQIDSEQHCSKQTIWCCNVHVTWLWGNAQNQKLCTTISGKNTIPTCCLNPRSWGLTCVCSLF